MKSQITAETAQGIIEKVQELTMELMPKIHSVNRDNFTAAEDKAIVSLGFQPAVYRRKLKEIHQENPHVFNGMVCF